MVTWYFETGAPPFVESELPASGSTGAALNTLITFDVVDKGAGVRASTLDAYVDGVDAYDGVLGFVAPFNGPSSSFSFVPNGSIDGYDAYHIVIDNTSLYTIGASVAVRATGEDNYGNSMDENWSFSIATPSSWYFDTGSPPFVESEFPAPGDTNQSKDTLIIFDVVDKGSGTRASTLDAYVNGADAYDGVLGFIAPFDGPSSSFTLIPNGSIEGYDAYHIVIDNTGSFAYNSTVLFRATGFDNSGNFMDESWSFSIRDVPDTKFLAEYLNTNIFNASSTLLINSSPKGPEICYNGADATIAVWDAYDGAGNQLGSIGSGSNVSVDKETPLLGANDLSVLFNRGKYFSDLLGNTRGDIDDECFVLSVLLKTPEYLEPGKIASKGGANGGWSLRFTKHLQKVALSLYGANGSTTIATSELQPNTWYYITYYVESGGTAYVFVDGKVNNTRDVSGIGSLSNSERLNLGSHVISFGLGFICLWTKDNWFSFPANYNEIVELEGQRFRQITATHPVVAGNYNPKIHERNSVGYLDKVESITDYRRYYRVGENWLRTCRRYDRTEITTEDGLLIERRFYNQVDNPENFDEWAANRMSVFSNMTFGPDNMMTADRLRESSNAGRHFIQSDVAITATSSEFYVASIFAKAISRDWIVLEVRSSFSNIVRYCYFDVKNGVVGTGSNVLQTGIEDWRGGWYRCWFSWSAGNLEEIIPWIPDRIRVYSASQNGVLSYTGSGLYTTNVAMAQVESDTCYPSNFTSANGVSEDFKSIDNLAYFAASNIYDGYGLLEAYGVIPQHDLLTYERSFVSITDGQDKWKRIQIYISPDGDRGKAVVVNRINPLVVPVYENTNIIDGYEHKVILSYADNNYNISVDDVAGTSGVAETIPRLVDRIAVGRSPNVSITPDTSDSLLIKRIKITK